MGVKDDPGNKVGTKSSSIEGHKKGDGIGETAIEKDGRQEPPKEVKYGKHYNTETKEKLLQPNISYITAEGYKYTTDEKGRIVQVEGTLQWGKAERDKKAQRDVGKGQGRREGTDERGKDEGGHLIACIFKGSGDIDNLVPMNSNLNHSAWRTMENAWANALKKKPPEEVQVKIEVVYKDEDPTQRPTGFVVKYKIGGAAWKTKKFKNEKGQTFYDK